MNGFRTGRAAARAAIAGLLLAAGAVRGGLTDPAADFAHAKEAYDAGRFEESRKLYEALLAAGYDSAELHFNLGNAWFRQGDAGRAVAAYRAAWRRTPRDPDVAKNIEMAQQSAGAPAVVTPWYARPFERISRREWAMALGAAYWLLAALAAVRLIRRRPSDLLRRATFAGIAAVALCAAGWWHWRSYDFKPEWVMVDKGRQALFAPLDSATAHFALPPGSVVRELGREAGWIKVGLGSRAGWVREGALIGVSGPVAPPPPPVR